MYLVGWGERKINNGAQVFPPGSLKSSLQNREKTKERNYASFLDENAHVQQTHPVTFLHTFFFSGCCLPLLLFFPSFFLSFCFFVFFWFIGQVCPIFFFLFLFLFFLFRCYVFYEHDFYFLINLGDWFFLLVYHFFGFNWTSFFNKGIHVNLYKLIFSIPSFSHSQSNKKEGN